MPCGGNSCNAVPDYDYMLHQVERYKQICLKTARLRLLFIAEKNREDVRVQTKNRVKPFGLVGYLLFEENKQHNSPWSGKAIMLQEEYSKVLLPLEGTKVSPLPYDSTSTG